MENIFLEYAEVKKNIAILEAFKESLQTKILEEMKDAKQITEFGEFLKVPKTTWKYSNKVSDLAEKVKLQQIKEQSNGTAKSTVTFHLRFNPNE